MQRFLGGCRSIPTSGLERSGETSGEDTKLEDDLASLIGCVSKSARLVMPQHLDEGPCLLNHMMITFFASPFRCVAGSFFPCSSKCTLVHTARDACSTDQSSSTGLITDKACVGEAHDTNNSNTVS
jgi:hypothetical protein